MVRFIFVAEDGKRTEYVSGDIHLCKRCGTSTPAPEPDLALCDDCDPPSDIDF